MSDTGYNSNSPPSRFTIRKNVSPTHAGGAARVSSPTLHVNENESDALDQLGDVHGPQVKPFNARSGRPHRIHGPPSRLNSPLRRQDSTSSSASLSATQNPPVSTAEAGAPTGSTSTAFSSSSGSSVPLSTSSPPTFLPTLPNASDLSTRSDVPVGSFTSRGAQSNLSTARGPSSPSTPFTSTLGTTVALTPTLGTTSLHQPGPAPRTSSQTEHSVVSASLASRQTSESNTNSSTIRDPTPVSPSPTLLVTPSPTTTPITTTLATSNISTQPSTTLSPTLIETSTINASTTEGSTSVSISTATAITATASMTQTSATTDIIPTIISTTNTSQITTATTTLSDSSISTAASTPAPTSSTLLESIPIFTSSSPTLSRPVSTGVIVSTTSFDVSSTIEPIPQSTTMPSSDNTNSTLEPTPVIVNSTIPFQSTSAVPVLTPQSETITLNIPLSHPTISTSTYTRYWTTAYPNGPTVTYSTIIETGVLSTDKSRPDDFAHNTGAVIGIALAGTFGVIASVFIIFFTCKKYKQRRDVVNGSRENFLSRDGGAGVSVWRSPLDDEEFEPGYGHRGLQSGAAVMMEGDGVTRQLPAGPVSYPSYPYDSGDGDRGENPGGRNGGFSGDASAESAMMYPVQQQSEPECWPNVVQIGLAVPYGYFQEPAGGSASDLFGDDHTARDAGTSTSVTGHGHQSNDAITSSVLLGSSSHGHLINAAGVGATQTSSSGHGIDDGGRRSKSASPVAERYQFPPSSYVPPGRLRTGSDSSGSGGGNVSDSSSVKGLFGKLKSMSKDMMREKSRSNSLQHRGSRSPGLSRSSGESVVSRPSISFSLGHSSGPGHTSLTSHHGHGYPYYGMPSSLLNPPKPMPMTMPTGDIPPVPAVRHIEPALTVHPYSIPDGYPHPLPLLQDNLGHGFELTSDSPYVDTWLPPTETSSYVEGLLNPHILPGASGGPGLPRIGVVKHCGVGGSDKVGWSSLGVSKDGGESVMSLRDNVDYSRPIGGAVAHRSTTTFGTDAESASVGIVETVDSSRSASAELERCQRLA